MFAIVFEDLKGNIHPQVNQASSYVMVLTTASLKWRLGAWSIQGLPLLAASP